MKRLIAGLILGSLLVMPVLGLAQEDTILEKCKITHDLSKYKGSKGLACPKTGEETNDPVCCILELISKVGDWIFGIVMVIALVVILIGAFTFITAAGDPEKVRKGRDYLICALIGVALAVLAKGIIELVKGVLSG